MKQFLQLAFAVILIITSLVYQVHSESQEIKNAVHITVPVELLDGSDTSCRLAGHIILRAALRHQGQSIIIDNWPELPNQPISINEAAVLAFGD